jgi:electron transfer flavoprotein beta subunit
MPHHIIAVVREVWDSRDLVADPVTTDGTLAGGLARRFDPDDLNALELALQIRDREGGKVTVVSVGAPKDVDVLRECLYRGADEALRVLAEGPLDTAAEAELLAAAIRRLGGHDLVLVGVGQPDGAPSLLGAELAGRLGDSQLGFVDTIVALGDGTVTCKREIEMGSETVRLPLPATLSLGVYLLKDDPRTPRAAKAMLKLKLKKTPIPEWTAAELGVDLAQALKVRVERLEAVPPKTVASREVDPQDEAALRAMLQDIQ